MPISPCDALMLLWLLPAPSMVDSMALNETLDRCEVLLKGSRYLFWSKFSQSLSDIAKEGSWGKASRTAREIGSVASSPSDNPSAVKLNRRRVQGAGCTFWGQGRAHIDSSHSSLLDMQSAIESFPVQYQCTDTSTLCDALRRVHCMHFKSC